MVKAPVLAVLLLPALVLAAAPTPRIQHPVTDTVGLLSPAQEESIATELLLLREDTGVQLAVLLVRTTAPEPIEDFSMRVAEAWRGGAAGRDDGLLFTLAVKDRRMRLEVGYGLEDVLPDDAVRQLLDAQIPFIREYRYQEALLGVIAGVRERVKARAAEPVAAAMEPWPVGGAPERGVAAVSADSAFFVGRPGFFVLCVLGGLMGTVLAFLWTRWMKESGLARVGLSAALVFGVPWVVTLLEEGGPYPASHCVWVLVFTAAVACLTTYIFLEGARRTGLFVAGVLGTGLLLALVLFDDVRPLDLLGDAAMMACVVGFAVVFFRGFISGGGGSSYGSYRSSDGSYSVSPSSSSSFFSSSGSSWSSSSSSRSSGSSGSSRASSSRSSSYSGGGGSFGGGGASSSW